MSSKSYPQIRRQQGLGVIGFLLITSVCIFIGLFAFKVGTHYFENWTVSKVTENLATKPDVLKQSRRKVYEHINQAYRTNNLWDLKAEETVELTRDAELGHVMTVNYERRTTLFRNIDLVTRFNKTVNGELEQP